MQAHPAAQWTNKDSPRALKDEPILDPASSFLLSDADFGTYLQRCNEAAKDAKLSADTPGNCPMLECQTKLLEAKFALLEATEQLTGVSTDRLRSGQGTIDAMVDLVLKMVSRHCDPHARFSIPRAGATGSTEHHQSGH